MLDRFALVGSRTAKPMKRAHFWERGGGLAVALELVGTMEQCNMETNAIVHSATISASAQHIMGDGRDAAYDSFLCICV